MWKTDRLPRYLTEPTDDGYGRDQHLSQFQLQKRIEQRRGIASQEEMVALFAHVLRFYLHQQNIMTGEIRFDVTGEFNKSVSFTLFLRKAGGEVAELRYRVGMDSQNQLFVRELPQLQKAREAVKALRERTMTTLEVSEPRTFTPVESTPVFREVDPSWASPELLRTA